MSCSGQNHTLFLSCLYAFALFNCQRCPYIAHMFLNFLYIVMFWHFKKPFQLETHCLFRASRFLEIARDSAQSMPLICKLTRGAPHLLYLAILRGNNILLCLDHPRARKRQLETILIAWSSSESFKSSTIISHLLCLVLSFLQKPQ